MPRDLFGSGTMPTALTRAFSRYTVLGSLALHLVVIAVVLIVPLLADDVMPRLDMGRVQFVSQVFTPPSPPAAVAPPQVRPAVSHDAAPILPPDRIRDPEPLQPANVAQGSFAIDAAAANTGFGADIGIALNNAAPAPPPVVTPPRPVQQGPVRAGGLIRQPVRTHYVAPVYPSIAQSARVEGQVQIEAIIGLDGVVQQARVVSGSPLLSDAALSAVRQWRYTPTTLNNQPVAVIMTVVVTFTLQH